MKDTHTKLQEEINALIENTRNLESCEGPHDFVREVTQLPSLAWWKCVRCGGRVRNQEMLWYLRGLVHGKNKVAAAS